MNEEIKNVIEPDYYKFKIKDVEMDVIDVAKAMGLPFTLSLALKYFRNKRDTKKKIEDLKKAIYCIEREIANLLETQNNYDITDNKGTKE